jgi:hypothetical protein
MNSIYPFFEWVDGTWLNKVINDSNWLFPAIEGVHIVALALLFGTVIVLNLRLLGTTMRHRPASQLVRELEPWTLCSLIVILSTGALLFAAEATRSFHSSPFRIKMVLLVSAVVFHYAVSKRLLNREEGSGNGVLTRAAAVLGIALWLGVGFAGRAIGFF